MNKKIILKTILYRMIVMIFITLFTYAWFGNLSSATTYTVVTAVFSTIFYYMYDVFWTHYFE